ncbi:unnamed protein product [Lactuca saligna]|uniref:Uncharacterized protein n=1 Tax=Lactuca saligna TaxID=75948 RepID=A0AA35YY17_LACSI|nr:unnamed protein product [Lactuca saligna]
MMLVDLIFGKRSIVLPQLLTDIKHLLQTGSNKELKGMMKTVKIQDIDKFSVPDDIDEDDLMGELDALEADMGQETEGEGVPSYIQPDNEPDLDAELNMPLAPSGHAVPVKPSIR